MISSSVVHPLVERSRSYMAEYGGGEQHITSLPGKLGCWLLGCNIGANHLFHFYLVQEKKNNETLCSFVTDGRLVVP